MNQREFLCVLALTNDHQTFVAEFSAKFLYRKARDIRLRVLSEREEK